MPGMTDLVEQKLLDHLLTDPTYTPATTLYIGLSSTTPTEAGGGITEPSGGGYTRVATTAADWSAASGTAPAQKTHTATFTFPIATADWVAAANLTHFVLFDHITNATAANVVAFGALTTPKAVLNGDTPSFAPGAMILQMGDPTDTY